MAEVIETTFFSCYEVGDKITFAEQYKRRTLFQWFMRRGKEFKIFRVTKFGTSQLPNSLGVRHEGLNVIIEWPDV